MFFVDAAVVVAVALDVFVLAVIGFVIVVVFVGAVVVVSVVVCCCR